MTKKFLLILLMLMPFVASAEAPTSALEQKIESTRAYVIMTEKLLAIQRDEYCPKKADQVSCRIDFNAARTTANRVLPILNSALEQLRAGNLNKARSELIRSNVSLADLLVHISRLTGTYPWFEKDANNTPAPGGRGGVLFLKTL